MILLWLILCLFGLVSNVEAAILYSANYEGGSYGFAQTCSGGTCPSGFDAMAFASQRSIQSAITRGGTGAVRIELLGSQADDSPCYLFGSNVNSGGGTNCTKAQFDKYNFRAIGNDFWIGFSVYFVSWQDTSSNPNPVLFNQINHMTWGSPCNGLGGFHSPPISLGVFPNGHLTLRREYDTSLGSCSSNTRSDTDLGVMATGQWYDFVMHVNAQYNNTGVLQLWMNGNLVVNLSGIPTVYNTGTQLAYSWMLYDSWWSSQNPTSSGDGMVVLFDNVKIGDSASSFAEVNPAPAGLQTNNKYFYDANLGKTVFLAGTSILWDQHDHAYGRATTYGGQSTLDYPAFLTFLTSRGLNYYRNWQELSTGCSNRTTCPNNATPMPYGRSGTPGALDGGNKFDLGTSGAPNFDEAYFTRLHDRIQTAGTAGVYVSVMLFDVYPFYADVPPSYGDPWTTNVFNGANNINGVDADTNKNGDGLEFFNNVSSGTIFAHQRALVRKILDTLNDLDNVFYEIDNEVSDLAWKQNLISYVKGYEATKAKQHLIYFSPGGSQTEANIADNANADVFSPSTNWVDYEDGGLTTPVQSRSKPAIYEMDHINYLSNDRRNVWTALTRGYAGFGIYDLPWDTVGISDTAWQNFRLNAGAATNYANNKFPNLALTTPSTVLSSTAFALTTSGNTNILVYNPVNGSFTVNLPAGAYSVEWFNPATLATTTAAISTSTSSGNRNFTPPFSGDSVLYLVFAGTGNNTAITWSNTRTSGSGISSVCCANWTISNLPLLAGVNPITVTGTDTSNNTGTDSITVTYAPSFPGNTLAGSWGFNEGSGTTVLDSSGNIPANDGSLINGAALTNALHVHDKGVSFTFKPGNPQYINVQDKNSLDFTQSFTFSGWLTLPSSSTAWQALFAKNHNYADQAVAGWPAQFLYASGGDVVALGGAACTPGSMQVGLVTNGGFLGASDLNMLCTSPLPTGNTPIFVAVTYDYNGTTGTLKVYRSDAAGLLAGTKTVTGYMEPTAEDLQIGSDSSDEGLTGVISSPRVYNYALPLSVGKQNVTFGAACDYADASPSIIQNANCAIIPLTPPPVVKLPASATGLKLGAGAPMKFGASP